MVTQLHHYFLVTGLRRWWFLSLMDSLLYFMILLSYFGYSSLVLLSASLEHRLWQHYHHSLRHALGLVALVIFVLLCLAGAILDYGLRCCTYIVTSRRWLTVLVVPLRRLSCVWYG